MWVRYRCEMNTETQTTPQPSSACTTKAAPKHCFKCGSMDHLTRECTSSWVCQESYCFKCADIHTPCVKGKQPKLSRAQRTKLCKLIAARRPAETPTPPPTTAPADEPPAPALVPAVDVGVPPAPIPVSFPPVAEGPPVPSSLNVDLAPVPIWQHQLVPRPPPRYEDVSVLIPNEPIRFSMGYEFLDQNVESESKRELKVPADPAPSAPPADPLPPAQVAPADAPQDKVPFDDYPALVQRVVHLGDDDDVSPLVQHFSEAESAPVLMSNNGRNWNPMVNVPKREPQDLAKALSGVHSLSAMKSRAARVYSGAYPLDDATYFVDGGRPIPLFKDVFDAQLEPSFTKVLLVIIVFVAFGGVTLLSNLSFLAWILKIVLTSLSRLNNDQWALIGQDLVDGIWSFDTVIGLVLGLAQLALLVSTIRVRQLFRLWLSYATQRFRLELFIRAEPDSDIPIFEDTRPIADRSVPYVPTILSKFELAVKIGLVDPFAAPLCVQEYGRGGGRDEPWVTYLRFGPGEGGHMVHLKHLCQSVLTRESGFAFTIDDDGLPKGEICVARQRRRTGFKRVVWDWIVKLIAPEYAGRTNILETAIEKLGEYSPSLFEAGAPREFMVSRGLFNQLWSMPVVLRPTMNLADYASHLRTTLVLPQERLNGYEPVRDTVDVVSLMLKKAPAAAGFR